MVAVRQRSSRGGRGPPNGSSNLLGHPKLLKGVNKMEKKIGDKTKDLNIQTKGKTMDFKNIKEKAVKVISVIFKKLWDLNVLHDERSPWSGVVVLSIIGILIMISPWTAIIVVMLTMAARIGYIERWLLKIFESDPL